MQYCTSCKKAIATIHILDLHDGSIVEQKHLCASCADQAGMVQHKIQIPSLKLGSEMLDLIGSLKGQESEPGRPAGAACPSCGLSLAEFKVRGRMGCPHCYEVFRGALMPILERVHDATCHRGRVPGRGANPPSPSTILADLRQRLAHAIDEENYEEAASLRDQIREAEASEETP
jgi:protein arginine kinase activator